MNDKAGSSATRTALLLNASRDTATTIATLSDGVTSITFAPFREKWLAQVKASRRDLSLAGHQPDVVNDAAYAQCALLDETVSRSDVIIYSNRITAFPGPCPVLLRSIAAVASLNLATSDTSTLTVPWSTMLTISASCAASGRI